MSRAAHNLMPAVLAVGAFLLLTLLVVGFTPKQKVIEKFNPPTLGEKVAAACKPGTVADWHVDYQDETLLQVTCYYPNTQEIKETVVER